MNIKTKQRIAIVHDAFFAMGGGERVALAMADLYPDAPIFTSVYFPSHTFPELKKREVITLPFSGIVHKEMPFKRLFPLWALGFYLLNLNQFDIVLSSSSYLARFINPPLSVKHICYCHTPFRAIWKSRSYSKTTLPISFWLLNMIIPFLRSIDRSMIQRIPYILTNSHNIASEIKQYYDRSSTVIYPPIKISDFSIDPSPEDYYLSVSRLVASKRVDLAVQACTKLNKKLVVVGSGPELANLKRIGGDHVTFVNNVTDKELRHLYSKCRALLFPSFEDFGIVPLEAQASGRPVIAYGAGGALETIKNNQTGVFFHEQTVDDLINAIKTADSVNFDQQYIRNHVKQFDIEVFNSKIKKFVSNI